MSFIFITRNLKIWADPDGAMEHMFNKDYQQRVIETIRNN